MLVTLTILIVSLLLASAPAAFSRLPALLIRAAVLLGLVAGLAAHLYFESFDGGGVAGQTVDAPSFAPWLGAPVFRTDTLSAGLGSWCLLLAALLVAARLPGTERGRASWRVVLYGACATVLYGLAHTFNALALGVEMLLLVVVVWALALLDEGRAGDEPTEPRPAISDSHSVLSLGLGALFILGAGLVIGRTTGGQFSLTGLSLSGIAGWPLILVAAGTALWLGLAPFTAWSGRVSSGHTALVQSLIIAVPIATLLLRLQSLVSAQGLAGSVPAGWDIFTAALSWLGGITAIAAGATTILWAGTPRWSAALTACMGGLMCWGLGLDNPAGRQAAVALLLALGAGRVTLELLERSFFGSALSAGGPPGSYIPATRAIALLSLAAVPLTAGFVGVWLLGAAVVQTRLAAFVMALAVAAILAACGAGLHIAQGRQEANSSGEEGNTLAGWLGILGSFFLLLGGVAPALWVPEATNIASVAGGTPPGTLDWTGLTSPVGATPLLLMGLAALALGLVGWLLRVALRSGVSDGGLLLPAAITRSRTEPDRQLSEFSPAAAGPQTAPAPVWWLSLQWVEEGVWGFGALLVRLGARLGIGLERLESRYYLPLALILVLVVLFAMTR